LESPDWFLEKAMTWILERRAVRSSTNPCPWFKRVQHSSITLAECNSAQVHSNFGSCFTEWLMVKASIWYMNSAPQIGEA